MRKKAILAGVFALMTSGAALNAQVTIGKDKTPEKFSVLELISKDSLGLRLPQMTTQQRDDITTPAFKANSLAEGLTIFNIDTKCVETWNGTVWINKCAMCGDMPCVYTRCPNANVAMPVFATYNLGGYPYVSAKAMMADFASMPANTTTNNGKVFGGRYQWGRPNNSFNGYYAISTDGNYTLYNGAASGAVVTANATYDIATGQIISYDNTAVGGGLAAGHHIYGLATSNYNWAYYWGTQADRDKLWGNGVGVATETGSLFPANPGILASDGKYYQSTSWIMPENDPCRAEMGAGWRIPTQDEWERIGNYDCNPNMEAVSFNTTGGVAGTVPSNVSPFTWVPVVCASGTCIANVAWDATANKGGYVIYRTVDWLAMTAAERAGDLIVASANPFLFLPAGGNRTSNGSTVLNQGC